MTLHKVLFDTATGKFKRDASVASGVDAGVAFSGLVDSSKFPVTYSAATRVFSVTYGSDAIVVVNGTPHVKTGTDTLTAHANTSGKYYFYFDATGTLVSSTSPWDLMNSAPLALVYYNATNAAAIILDERHPALSGMDNATHKNLHLTRGTQTVSGFAISGYTLSTAGAAALSYAIATGVIADEDLFFTCSPLADGGPYRVLYRSSSNGEWVWSDTSTTGIQDDGTNIYYNQFTGGAWTRTAVATNNRWINYYVVAVGEYTGTKRTAIVMGQTLHTTLAAAQAEDPATSIAGLSELSDEFVYLYRLTYQRISGSSPSNAQLISVQGLRSNTISVTGGFSSSDHQTLSNRTAIGCHPASSVSVVGSGVISAVTDTQGALDILAVLPSNLWTEYWFNVTSLGGQTEFSVPTLNSAGQVLDVLVNGVTNREGAIYDWQRNIVDNKVVFNSTVKQNADVRVRLYK